MTPRETAKLFTMIAVLYPNKSDAFLKSTELMRDAWHKMLEDVPYELAETAVQMHVSSSPFPPSIAEIRKYAVEAKCPVMPADEAYKLASDARRKFGWCNAQDGMESLPEPVRATIRTYCGSFHAWCSTEEPQGVERSQFMRIYEAVKERKQKAAALPPGVADKLVGNIGLLEG